MPELPEVETIRLGLLEMVVGKTINKVEVFNNKSLQISPEDIDVFVLGAEIVDVKRRAKVLMLELDNDYSLIIHLKMTGQIIVDTSQGDRFGGGHPTKSMTHELPDRSTRVMFTLDRGDRLFFNDQRKFGWIKLVPKHDLDQIPLLAKAGPEPLSEDFTVNDLYKKTQRTGRNIKAVLLDQSIVAGLGNIYVDEALHLAKIHPETPADRLKRQQIEDLRQAIRFVLQKSLDSGGTSFTNYVNVLGLKGNYLNDARVFRKEGQLCLECDTEIIKIRVAGRGTHVCPTCQRKHSK